MNLKANKDKIAIGAAIALIVIIIGLAAYILVSNNNSSGTVAGTEETTLNTDRTPPERGEFPQDGDRPEGGGPGGMTMISEEEQAAIDAGDYEAWLDAVDENNLYAEYITSEADFQLYVELQQAMEDRDMERVEEIQTELGIPAQVTGMPPEGMGEPPR